MKFYLVKLLTNTQGQDASEIAVYADESAVKVAYHQMLAPVHNADDVLYAVVQILDEYGRVLGGYREEVDHRPAPEPSEE